MQNKQPQGYIALVTVLILSAVILGITSSVSLLGIGEAQSSLANFKGENALQLVEGCAEDALLKAQQSSTYNGGNIMRPEGTCVVSVTKSGNSWTILVTSTQQDYNRTIVIKFTRGSTLATSSWTESMPTNTPTPTNTATPTQTQTPTPTITIAPSRGGMLVFGAGGCCSNAIKYRTFSSSGTWNSVTNFPTNPGASSSWLVSSVRVYASSTRNEKITVVSMYDGSANLAVFANVWNGSSWSSWTTLASSYASSGTNYGQPFDGTYLNNGDFMVVYSDGTGAARAKIWNGSSWGSAMTLPSQCCQITFVTAAARPGTNEVMVSTYSIATNIYTDYYNGKGYANSNWVTYDHGSGPHFNNEHQVVDFAWSPYNPMVGALTYQTNETTPGGDYNEDADVFTANGTGGGSWNANLDMTVQPGVVGPLAVIGSPNSGTFSTCGEDLSSSNAIDCYDFSSSDTQKSISNGFPLASTGASGAQRGFDIGYESLTGNNALIVYSDNTTTPKYKKYTPGSPSSWSASASSMPVLNGVLKSVKLIPVDNADDIMVLMGDVNTYLYSIVWNGSANAFYTTPSGKALVQHTTDGYTTSSFWYDFAWDKF